MGEGGLVHWDDVEPQRDDEGHFGFAVRRLGRAAGCVAVTVNRAEISPGRWSTPAHVEDEEIFYVLGGSGLSWQDGTVYEVREGDCVVHRARAEAHTLRGGDEGLDVLAFGRAGGDGHATLPRAGVTWLGSSWVASGLGDHPWDQEAAVGEPEVGEPEERPKNIVNVGDLEQERWIDLADAAGSAKSGLNVVTVAPGKLPAPAHCHSAEEEIFVILEGDGTLELWPSPLAAERGAEREDISLRPGHVIARPPGGRVGHAFQAGPSGLTMLIYGTRRPNDMAWFPRSNKIFWRGLGVIGRIETLEYDDGEPDD